MTARVVVQSFYERATVGEQRRTIFTVLGDELRSRFTAHITYQSRLHGAQIERGRALCGAPGAGHASHQESGFGSVHS